ncbi:hypothetical protein FE257_013059 [Aspergillus nanangensis]|uniref:NADP-dependent oxidoreductase domain-containing protein n=1 Tax=Aspergillus nanangensis TaxID=2582783 RepID=A0AAD4CEY5_ASPNN|nr:hypothetical protein FE257_013059 [Aspergillus nanangensis]
MNALYQAGKFRRFGLSNFLPEEVENVISLAKKNYILPSVYQGNYNAVGRISETELFPILRRHNISFYAYSPVAGGFLTKKVEHLVAGTGGGRFDVKNPAGTMYNSLYNKPSMLEGLKLWEQIAEEAGIPKAELAYRWVVYHSALKEELGDKVVFGARGNEQLRQTLAAVKNGPLSPEIAQRIEEVWTVKHEAPLDNFNSFVARKSEAEVAAYVRQRND